MLRRLVPIAVVVGALIATGALLANSSLNLTATPAQANVGGQDASGTGTMVGAPLANGTNNGTNGTSPNGSGPRGGLGFGGWGGRHGGYGGYGPGLGRRGGALTVTSVNAAGNTISATAWRGQAVTVTVSATTTYTVTGYAGTGMAASLSDVHTGSTILVRGTSTGTNTINATAVYIILPSESGVVTDVNGDTLTLTTFNGASRTVTVSGSTRYQKAGAAATQGDVTKGTAIVAEGTLQSDGSLSAVLVVIEEPRIAGQVTAVNGSSYTVAGRGGTTYTVDTTGSTTYVNPNGTSVQASTIVSGTYIMAEGTLSTDGKTLTAQRIVVGPARTAAQPGTGTPGGRFGWGGGRRHGVGPLSGQTFGSGSQGFGFGDGGQGFGFGSGGQGSQGGTVPGVTAPSTTGTQNV